MTFDEFLTLYREAWRREHAIYLTYWALPDGEDWPALVRRRTAASLLEIRSDFFLCMADPSLRYRKLLRPGEVVDATGKEWFVERRLIERCSICGRDDCPNRELQLEVSSPQEPGA